MGFRGPTGYGGPESSEIIYVSNFSLPAIPTKYEYIIFGPCIVTCQQQQNMYSKFYAPDGTQSIQLVQNEMGKFFFNSRDNIYIFSIN